MSDKFIPVNEKLMVSPQITVADIDAAKAAGVALIINNRPDGEEAGQPEGEQIAAAAKAAGIDYLAVPMGPAGVSHEMIDAVGAAMTSATGPVLAYCRSGTRSITLWAFVQAKAGKDADETIATAADAGYNLSQYRRMFAELAEAAS